ncbi:interactor protein for cytohesin exchange factors 1 [Megalops cyprinoides]|uniref:interactor protein for cytohesin exchange factors 1 n=1 Tax=Megalops cyprinoides TaxID=118141 RepID=UPI001864741B|nr:interactor protein for cytohesin exchange factors 1 [Megalops cyprinoides]
MISCNAVSLCPLFPVMLSHCLTLVSSSAMKAHHPQIMAFYFAAESSKEMYKWLSKLSEQVSSQDAATDGNTGECYSEASDHEEAESMEVSSNSEQATTASGSLPSPSITSSPNETAGSAPSPVSASSPVSAVTSQNSPLANHSQSWLNISMTSCPESAETTVCCMQDLPEHPLQPEAHTGEGFHRPPSTLDPPVIVLSGDHQVDQVTSPSSEPKDDGCQEAASDEMEKLYIHLKEASLSPTGERKPSTKREFRSSFIKRCKNQNINEKLHLMRTLNSTLKAKEADLLTIEQVLADPSLSALKYREWKEANFLLLQEIFDRQRPQGGSVEQPVAAACIFAETSV